MTTILLAFFLLWGWSRYRRQQRQRHIAVQSAALPDITDLVLAALQAGCSSIQVVEFLARAAPTQVRWAFIEVVTALDRGERFSTVMHNLVITLGPEFRPLCDILSAGDRLGIPTEILVAHVSSDAHLARRLQADAEARRLPVRLSIPLVCCTLPSFVVLVIVPVLAGTLSHLHITD